MITDSELLSEPKHKGWKLPKIWRKYPFTEEEMDMIGKLLGRAKFRIKFRNPKTKEKYIKQGTAWHKENRVHANEMKRASTRSSRQKFYLIMGSWFAINAENQS